MEIHVLRAVPNPAVMELCPDLFDITIIVDHSNKIEIRGCDSTQYNRLWYFFQPNRYKWYSFSHRQYKP